LKISKKAGSVELSAHRKVISIARKKAAQGRTVYNFSQGQPSLPPEQAALTGFADRLLAQPFEVSRYSEVRGIPGLLEAISADLKLYGSCDASPEQILPTDGAIEGLSLALDVLADPGDGIVMFDPCYAAYWDLLHLHDLRPIPVPQLIDSKFQPDPEDIKRAASLNPAAILLCSPDNPTSRIISEEAAATIVDEARDRRIPLLYDEAYKHIVFEGKHVWLQKYQGMDDLLVCLDSFSKELAIPGFRLGYSYGPKGIIDQMAKVKSMTTICSPTPSQYLALEYLTRGLKGPYLRRALEVYRRRRDTLYSSFKEELPDAKVELPLASMYLFPDVKSYLGSMNMDDVSFCLRLAEEADVAVIPGSVSGPGGSGHLRMCFIGDEEPKLVQGLHRMAQFIKSASA
jgi:aspartate aminotransferase